VTSPLCRKISAKNACRLFVRYNAPNLVIKCSRYTVVGPQVSTTARSIETIIYERKNTATTTYFSAVEFASSHVNEVTVRKCQGAVRLETTRWLSTVHSGRVVCSQVHRYTHIQLHMHYCTTSCCGPLVQLDLVKD